MIIIIIFNFYYNDNSKYKITTFKINMKRFFVKRFFIVLQGDASLVSK